MENVWKTYDYTYLINNLNIMQNLRERIKKILMESDIKAWDDRNMAINGFNYIHLMTIINKIADELIKSDKK